MSASTDTRLTIGEQLQHMSSSDVLGKLPMLCRLHRRTAGLSYRQAARAIGLDAHSALYELEHGADVRLSTVTAVVRWLEGWV